MLDFIERSDSMNFNDVVKMEIEQYNSKHKKHFLYEPSIIKRGIYFEQIERYLSYFPFKSFMFIESELFFKEKITVLNQVLKFLNVADCDWDKIDLSTQLMSDSNEKIPAEEAQLLSHFYKDKNDKLYALIKSRYDW